jgi:hypothetical protein
MKTTEVHNPAICANCNATLLQRTDSGLIPLQAAFDLRTRVPVWPERNLGVQVPFTLCMGCSDKLGDLFRRDDLSEATEFSRKCMLNSRSILAAWAWE